MPATFLRLVATSHTFNLTLLILLAALLYLPGLSIIPPIDRDEARFAQATRQMLETGEYFNIRFQTTPRHKKPPGIHHLQIAAVKTIQIITGNPNLQNKIWPYRIPSVLASTYTILLLYFFAAQILQNKSIALAAATLLATSILMVIEAHQATTDAALTAALTTSLATLAILHQNQTANNDSHRRKLIIPTFFWLALTFAFYLKGPIAIIIPAVAITTICIRNHHLQLLRALRPLLLGLPIFIILTACWAIPLHRATQGTFWRAALLSDFLPKLTRGVESHAFPPGFYLVILVITFWPASLVVGYALLQARQIIKTKKPDSTPPADQKIQPTAFPTLIQFLFASLIPIWIILELIPTKLPHYVLPLYPALALLTAIGCSRLNHQKSVSPRPPCPPRTAQAGFIFWALITLTVGISIVYLLKMQPRPLSQFVIIPLALIFASTAVFTTRAACRAEFLSALVTGSIATVLITILLLQFALPQHSSLWLSRAIAESLHDQPPLPAAQPADLVAAGYHEPSLIFLTTTQTQLLSGKGAAEYFIAHPQTATIIIDHAKAGPAFQETLKQHGYALPQPIAQHLGFNYSKGTKVNIKIYRNLQPDIRQAHSLPRSLPRSQP